MISYPMSPARDTSTFVGCQLNATCCAMNSDAHLRIASFPVSIGAFGGSSELSSAKNETNCSTFFAPAAFDHWASESRSTRSSSARVSGAGAVSFSRHVSVNIASPNENTRNATHRFRLIEYLRSGISRMHFPGSILIDGKEKRTAPQTPETPGYGRVVRPPFPDSQ